MSDSSIFLPQVLPIFPLSGAILLPKQKLPLNIFETRYMAMARKAKESDCMIGLVQSLPPYDGKQDGRGNVFPIGGAGKIVQWHETIDGRIELVLEGVSRFRIDSEIEGKDGYRRVVADWTPFASDLEDVEHETELQAAHVGYAMKQLFEAMKISVKWAELDTLDGEEFVDLLAMVIPFPPEDKQAMLEAKTSAQRFEVMKTLAELYAGGTMDGNVTLH